MDNIIGSIILEGASTVEDAIITKDATDRVIATGTLQDLEVENRNRRIYLIEDMKPEINGARMRELIAAHEFKGEYGHPLSEDLVRQQTIDPKLVCVEFMKVWLDGNLIKANFRGTNNDYGSYFDKDLRTGHKPAFSLRALGSIEVINGKAYVKGIKIITWDSVIYPSHKVAYTDKIISESGLISQSNGYINENQIMVPKDDPGKIITLYNSDAKEAIERLQRESANVSRIMETFEGLYDKVTLLNENTLALTSRYGEYIEVNLEKHVNNVIMDYCFKM